MVKNVRKILLVNLLIFFLSACSSPPSYTRKDIGQVIKNTCKKEFNIDVNVWVKGDTIWVYAPFSELIKEVQPQDKSKKDQPEKKKIYQVSNLETELSKGHLTVVLDVMINPRQVSQDSDKESELTEKATEDMRRISHSLQRAFFNMDNPPKFYCFIASDVEQIGIDHYSIAFVPDMVKYYLELISLNEREKRTVRFQIRNPRALGDLEGKHIQPYDISLNEFMALLIAQDIEKEFNDPDKERLLSPLDVAQEVVNEVLDVYSSLYTISSVTINDTFNNKIRKPKIPPPQKRAIPQPPKAEVENALAKLQQTNFYFRQGLKYYSTKSFAKAREFFEKIIELLPDYTPALNYLGDIYNKLDQPKKAITYLERAIKIEPNNADAYYYLGHSYAALGEYQPALDQYRKALQINPDYSVIYYSIALAYYSLEEYKTGIDYLQKALKDYSDKAEVYYLLGTGHFKLGQYSMALTYYKKVVDLNPEYPGIYTAIGSTYQFLDNHTEAIANYEKALEINPDLLEAYLNLGSLYRTLGQYEKAIANYQKALQIYPDLVAAYVGLGITYDNSRQHEKAIDYFQKALNLDPDNLEAYYNLGWAYINLTQFEMAIFNFEKAIATNSDYAEGYLGLGIAYDNLNQYPNARENLQKAKELFEKQNNFKAAQKVEERLRLISPR